PVTTARMALPDPEFTLRGKEATGPSGRGGPPLDLEPEEAVDRLRVGWDRDGDSHASVPQSADRHVPLDDDRGVTAHHVRACPSGEEVVQRVDRVVDALRPAGCDGDQLGSLQLGRIGEELGGLGRSVTPECHRIPGRGRGWWPDL